MSKASWRAKPLLLCHLAAALLVLSLFWTPTQTLWKAVDLFFFQAINQTLIDHPWWQTLWALASHKNADWAADLCFFGFFLLLFRRSPPVKKREAIAQILFCILYSAAIIYFFNRILLREYLHIPRYSPSLVVPEAFYLPDAISWLSFKTTSSACFPGDHATTALLFAGCYTYFSGRKGGLCAFAFAALLCFPRLITGAHWLSDILVGSGAIVLIFLSWAFCTPLYSTWLSLSTHFGKGGQTTAHP